MMHTSNGFLTIVCVQLLFQAYVDLFAVMLRAINTYCIFCEYIRSLTGFNPSCKNRKFKYMLIGEPF